MSPYDTWRRGSVGVRLMVAVSRTQVLAYREQVHGLERATEGPARLGVFELGVQDTPAGSARLALGARLEDLEEARAIEGDNKTFIEVWSVRGAPHFIRRKDARGMVAALRPWSNTDAEARLAGFGVTIHKLGVGGLAALDKAIVAVHASLKDGAMTKGELSEAVTKRLDAPLIEWCRSCKATHVSDPLFRLATFPGGARIVPGSKPLSFVRLEGMSGPSIRRRRTEDFVRAYLRLNGPATSSDAAAFLATTTTELKRMWPDGLTEVSVDSKKAFIPSEDLEDLRTAEPASIVRLLPPSDPILAARDRGLLVPDARQRAALWANLSRRGALWANGDIWGMWQVKGTKRADVTLTPFHKVPKSTITRAETEAERVATLRGAADYRLVVSAGG